MQTLFEVASPTTLASLIADIEATSYGHLDARDRLRREAWNVLEANVGEDEACKLVNAACDATH